MAKKQDRITKLTWVYISGIASLFFVVLAVLMIIFAPNITSAGITKSIYYILLIPVGLAAAAFLFGALRSGAKYSGKTSYGSIELTGPVVIFCLVVIGGFYFATPESEFLLTIRTNIEEEPDKILNSGTIVVDIGDQRIDKKINENGEASFPGIPSRFLGKEIKVIAQIKGYKIKDNSPVFVPDERIIYLDLERKTDSTFLRGRVFDEDNNPLDSVLIDIENGLASAITDENGLFALKLPAAEGETILITAIKNGSIGHREYILLQERASIEIKFSSEQ